jgi:hypothetical protein
MNRGRELPSNLRTSAKDSDKQDIDSDLEKLDGQLIRSSFIMFAFGTECLRRQDALMSKTYAAIICRWL